VVPKEHVLQNPLELFKIKLKQIMKNVIKSLSENVAATNKSSEVNANGRLEGRSALTTKRLMNSGRTKGLFFGTFATVFVVVVSILIFYGCQKDTAVQNGNSINEKEMMSTGDDYPFVLPAAMAPYQYAVYEDDINVAFDYMQIVFDAYVEGDEIGYFTFSYNTDNTLIHYGFITPTSSYYDPNIWIEPDYPTDPDDDGGMCFVVIITTFDNSKDAWAFLMEMCKKGYEVSIKQDPKTKKWTVSYDDGN
jgi:hypothetical protein